MFDLANPEALILTGDNQKYGSQFSCGPFAVKPKTDYVVELSTRIDQGRMRVSVEDGNGRTYTSEILEPLEIKQPAEQPIQTIRLPFVSMARDTVQIDFSNEASNAPPTSNVDADEALRTRSRQLSVDTSIRACFCASFNACL